MLAPFRGLPMWVLGFWVKHHPPRWPRKSLAAKEHAGRAAEHAAAAGLGGKALDPGSLIGIADLAAAVAGERVQLVDRHIEEPQGAPDRLVREALLGQHRIASGDAKSGAGMQDVIDIQLARSNMLKQMIKGEISLMRPDQSGPMHQFFRTRHGLANRNGGGDCLLDVYMLHRLTPLC